MRGDRFRENPPLGAPWLTPQIEARLRDLERREIKRLTAKWDAEEGIHCCREMSAHALKIVEAASGQKGMIYSGIVLYPRDPGGWPNADWCQLDGAYHHYWVILDDGTIVDAATTQFGERCPLVIPLGHPLQRRYVPEHPTEEEFESGAVPLDIERWKKSFRRNPRPSPEDLRKWFASFEKAGLVVSDYLGSGAKGIAVLLNDGRVLKVTSDPVEAAFALWLIENPTPSIFPRVFEVWRDGNEYGIVRESVDDIPLDAVDRAAMARLHNEQMALKESMGLWIGDAYDVNIGVRDGRYLIRDFGSVKVFKDSQGARMISEMRKRVPEIPVIESRLARPNRRNPYYHGSKTPLKIGTIIRPKADGYVQQQYADGSEDNWVERAIEKGRPKDKLSRLKSVFMLKLDESELQRPDLPDTFDQVGGYGEHIYEVEPLGRVERSDMKNYTMAAYPELFFDKDLKRYRAMAVEEYWSGDDADGVFEYRTPAARVVRRVGGSKGKG